MYDIKFSENYYKMPLPMPFKAMLMQAIKVNYKELSRCFIAYDTEFKDGAYELPKTDLILLILITNIDDTDDTAFVFTTMRRFTPEKWKFYKSLEGEDVGIVATQEKETK
jgi:hypothetical protein